MPKGKAKQRQAGAAAVPTARTSVFTPPDAAAHAKYQHLVEVFSRAFEQAGVSAPDWMWDLWGECCRIKGKRSICTITALVRSLCTHYDNDSAADVLAVLFAQRVMITANIHLPIFHCLTSQQGIDEHTFMCMNLLAVMFGGYIANMNLSKVPRGCLPDTAPEVLSNLTHLHWHPRSVGTACQALLCARNVSQLHASVLYVTLLKDRAQWPGHLAPASNIDFAAVLGSPSCMKALLAALQHPDHTALVTPVLVKAVTKTCEPSISRAPSRSRSASVPGTLSLLLRMGAAEPLATALNHLTSELERKQRQQQQQQLQQQEQEQEAQRLLAGLTAAVGTAVIFDRAVHLGCTLGAAVVAGSAHNAPWPPELLEAHIGAQIKVMATELESSAAPDFSRIQFIGQYPPDALPAAARQVLSRHPARLFDLITLIEVSGAAIPTVKVEAAQATTVAMELLASVLEVTNGTMSPSIQHLPLRELGACTTKAMLHATTEMGRTPQDLHREGTEGAIKYAGRYAGLLQATGKVRDKLSKLPGWDDVDRELHVELAVERESAAHALRAFKGREDVSSRIKAAQLSEGPDSIVHAIRLDGVGSGGGGGGGEGSSKCSGSPEHAAAGCSGSVESKGGSRANGGGAGKAERACASCGRVGKLKACGRCEAAWFCGVECQRTAWPSHRLVCTPKGAARSQ